MRWREVEMAEAFAWASTRTVGARIDEYPPGYSKWDECDAPLGFTDGSAVFVRSNWSVYESGSFERPPEFWIGEPEEVAA